MKIILAIASIGYAAFVWFFAAQSSPTAHEDWAGVMAVVVGLPGGIVQFLVAIFSTIHHLKHHDAKPSSKYDSPPSLAPMMILFHIGWVITLFAMLKVYSY